MDKITKKQFGPKGKAMISYLISGLLKAKSKWSDVYKNAQTETERMNALVRMNYYAEAVSMYSKMKGGIV